MALASYADQEYYEKVSGVITTDDLEKRLHIASRHIDTLTFNRIVARGFENLTEFQKDVISLGCFAPEYRNFLIPTRCRGLHLKQFCL